MRKYLRYDPEARELRLVYTDLYNGQHEQTEYRVTGGRGGDVVRSRPDLDGEPVFGTAPDLHIKGPLGEAIPVWTQDTAVGPTVRTPCAKAASARRKCGLCTADIARERGLPTGPGLAAGQEFTGVPGAPLPATRSRLGAATSPADMQTRLGRRQ